jgi:hypothetical protein
VTNSFTALQGGDNHRTFVEQTNTVQPPVNYEQTLVECLATFPVGSSGFPTIPALAHDTRTQGRRICAPFSPNGSFPPGWVRLSIRPHEPACLLWLGEWSIEDDARARDPKGCHPRDGGHRPDGVGRRRRYLAG